MVVVLAIIAAPLAAMLCWAVFVYVSWSVVAQPPGEVPYEEWPHHLQHEWAEWRKDGIAVDGMEVYDADAMFHSKAYCRLPYSPEAWAYLKQRYGGPEEGSIDAEREHWSHVADELPDWAPSVNDPATEFEPFDNPNGEEGLTMRVAYDPKRGLIYLDYYLNF
jgi:hypothetical protein